MKGMLFAVFLFSGVAVSAQDTLIEKGRASYYADKFKGRRTASGERFFQDSLTAAHKSLPFGTVVKVVNTNNNKEVIVRINDRLPQKSKRNIDLSKAAAREIDMIRAGLVPVRIVKIGEELP